MIFKIITSALLSLHLLLHQPDPPLVQIFDVKQEKVVKQYPLNRDLEKSITELLNASPRMYGGIDMNPKSGLILHAKFKSPIQISSLIYPDSIKEVYLFLEPEVDPKALIFFSSSSKFIIVVLKGDSDQFMKENNLR